MGLSGRKNVDGIMNIVIPFGGKQRRITTLLTGMQGDNIAAIFGSKMNGPVGNVFPNTLCDFNQHMLCATVFDLIDGVKA